MTEIPNAVPTNNLNILRLRNVISRTGLSRSSIYELIAKEKFPRPVNLEVRAVGWVESEIASWIAERIESSRIS